MDLQAAKRALRLEAARRREAAHVQGAEAAAAFAARCRDVLAEAAPRCVALYWPVRTELDVRKLIDLLRGADVAVALPVVVARGMPLAFRRWSGEALVPAGFGLLVPPPDAPDVVPDALVVPLLAFDRQGWRLGYGGGYYDHTLAALRAGGRTLAIGAGYAAQEVDAVPHGAHDQRLDRIVTERETIVPEAA